MCFGGGGGGGGEEVPLSYKYQRLFLPYSYKLIGYKLKSTKWWTSSTPSQVTSPLMEDHQWHLCGAVAQAGKYIGSRMDKTLFVAF